jgi:hypothetical protein
LDENREESSRWFLGIGREFSYSHALDSKIMYFPWSNISRSEQFPSSNDQSNSSTKWSNTSGGYYEQSDIGLMYCANYECNVVAPNE